MLDILLTASVAFVITFIAIPTIIQVAEKKQLYDVPDQRKIHRVRIASLGGVGIFSGFLLASILSIQSFFNPEFQYFFAAAIVIFFLGLKDDLVILSATKKFIGQIIAAAILIHLGGLRIDSMHGILGYEELPESFSLALSYLTIILIINSFNLIDGVDGLATSLGILTTAVFGAYFFAIGFHAYALLAFAMTGSLIAFLIFNHQPAKIFMGDSGSLMIGLINAILVIKFIQVADQPYLAFQVPSAVVIGFAILMVPLLDTLRVFSIRIYNGRSPFTPDRNHVHHLLLDKGLSHKAVTFTCLLANIIFIAIAWLGKGIGPNYLLLILLVIAMTALGILYNSKHKIFHSGHSGKPAVSESKVTTKVVKLAEENAAASNN